MTRDELYELFTELNGGEQIDTTLFNSYLDIAQAVFEAYRPWVLLRKEKNDQTVNPSITINTNIDMPDDFARWYDDRRSIGLLYGDPSNYNIIYVKQIPLSAKYGEKDLKFFVDYTTNKMHLTGTLAQSYTLCQFYIRVAELVSEENEWVFPVRFHRFLALASVVYYKLGVDYDLVNNPQGEQHAAMAAQLLGIAADWDDDLERTAVAGLDAPGPSGYQSGRLAGDWYHDTY